jgi:predicted metal-dependent hydrolase
MKKKDRISNLVRELGADPALSLDARYQGYFTCFNGQQYYEAHDVLENLWLERRDEHHLFFKGLIQLAGAFVHLQKQFVHPTHPKHGRRMRPAVRLFRLAAKNLATFAPRHLQLDVAAVLQLCERQEEEILAGDYEKNPWKPAHAPQLHLLTQ